MVRFIAYEFNILICVKNMFGFFIIVLVYMMKCKDIG